MVDQKILDAFQTMWGLFPEPVTLVHKNRTILAINNLARTAGCTTGVKCFSSHPEAVTSSCKDCKAELALREHRTVGIDTSRDGKHIISYWMPLEEAPDLYVHFGVGCAAAIGIEPYPLIRDAKAELVTLAH